MTLLSAGQCFLAKRMSALSVEQREEVIEARVFHKRLVQAMYQWRWQLADSDAQRACSESLETLNRALAALAKSGVGVLLLHGTKDTVVQPQGTRDVEVRMRKAGVAVTVKWFECAHGVAPEVATASIAWLDKVVRP